jgi:general stress protein YciG
MDAERQREIASMGGKAVPDSKRSFSQNRRLAAEAGRKGGQSVPGSKRSFSQNPELAAEAGRKGGQASHGGNPATHEASSGSEAGSADKSRQQSPGGKGGSH